MKNVKIDDDIFGESKIAGDKKDKSKSNKAKSKKNKGEDFLDYATKNGIELNLVYEDKVNAKEEKRHVNNGPQPTHIKKNPRTFQKNDKYPNQDGKKYYKNSYSKKPYYKKPFKTGNNKFDQCNMHLSKMMPMMPPLYNPYTMQHGGFNYTNVPSMPQMNMGYYNPSQAFPLPEIVENSDKSISDFLEAYLSLDNLNQDMYLRNRIDDNGFIVASEIANHNKLRSRGVTVEKLASIFGGNTNSVIEAITQDGNTFFRNRDWEAIKEKLVTKEQIHQQKKMIKNANYMNSFYNPMANPSSMNYVSMQNNYFFNNGMPNTNLAFGMSAMYLEYPNNMMNPSAMTQPQMTNVEQGEQNKN